ncbi:MAG: hypothetical protein LIO65_04970, partial [Odoribacter sp.]|nr:hypothetical protein [Odoribacter sp.]
YIEALGKEIPGIEAHCFMSEWGYPTLKVEDENGEIREYQERFIATSPGFIDVFGLEVLEGDKFNWLESNNKVALPEKVAKNSFPTEMLSEM